MRFINYETLFELYVEKLWTQKAIANYLDCSIHNVRKYIHRYQLPTNQLLRKLRITEEELKRYLHHLYIEKGLTIQGIAIELNVSKGVIQRNLASLGITKKKSGQISKQVLKELYLDQSLSVPEIANRFSCGISQVYTLIQRYGLPSRKPVMGLRKKLRMSDEELADYLYHLYWNQKLTMPQIAKKLEVSDLAIWRHFKRLCIPTRDRRDRFGNQEEKNNDYRKRVLL
jgi:predicted DNA-binding protein YlxM (UPF0122 family)